MFGQSQGGWIGTTLFAPGGASFVAQDTAISFLFQAVFCSTAVTIFSGAVAERTAFKGFVFLAFFVSILVYPLVGHWIWNENGWLRGIGVYDFAGTIVVHGVGGWVALAAVMVIGPRLGRFSETGDVVEVPPFSLALSTLGVLILCLGWIGFNGGSVTEVEDVGYVVLNTLISGTFGAMGVLLVALWKSKVVNVSILSNGLLAGLVSITGCADIVVGWQAALIGFIGAGVMYLSSQILLKLRIDDAIDAIPVHLGAGIWGTLAVAIFGKMEALNVDSRIEMLGIQSLAIVVSGIWAFGLTYLFAKAISKFVTLRVSEKDELLGLNISEHGQVDPLRDLIETMQYQAKTGDVGMRVSSEPYTESQEVAHYYNKTLDTIQNMTVNLEQAVQDRTEDLEKETRKALYATQAKSMFLANMSHELRTPLNSIIGMTGLVMDTKMEDEQKEMVGAVHQASETFLEIVNDVLDFSKIESGALELEHIGFDFLEVLNRVLYTLTPLASEKGNVLNSDIENIEALYLIGDPIRFGGILTNLIGNAIKYTSDGIITVDIKVNEIDDSQVMLYCAVTDTGIGIPKDRQSAIFEKFSQAESSTTRKYGGTGLGLSITKRLVRMMDGTIGLTSVEGEGSTFWFKIPFKTTDVLNDDVEDNDDDLSNNEQDFDSLISYQNIRILIAEDHELNTLYLKKLMTKWLLNNVTFVTTGAAAFAAAKTEGFDLILMDCHMPDMNGYDATKAIRAHDNEDIKHIPIIALTADVIKGTEKRCLDAGMNAYVTKPINQKKLKKLFKKWIDFAQESKEELTHKKNAFDAPVDTLMIKNYADTPEEEQQFIGIFLAETEQSISILNGNCTDGGNEIWKEAAHKIKGGAGTLGAIILQTLCEKALTMEQDTKKEKTAIVEEIEREYKSLKEYLSNLKYSES